MTIEVSYRYLLDLAFVDLLSLLLPAMYAVYKKYLRTIWKEV